MEQVPLADWQTLKSGRYAVTKSLNTLSKRNDVSRIISFIRKQEEEIMTPMRNDMAAMKAIFSQLLDTIKTI